MPTLIKQAYVLGLSDQTLTGAEGVGDVLIEDGRIKVIAPSLSSDLLPDNTHILNGQGQFLGPGLVDLYSQSGEPGNESRETHATLKQAAIAGGFTRVGVLPNTAPAVDNVSAITAVQQANQTADQTGAQAQTQLLPWATITQGGQGEQLNELAELADAGALGFTDSRPITNSVLLRRLLEYAQPLQKPIALWPCNPQLAGRGVAREGTDALRLGLAGVSAIAETTALTTLLECIAEIPALVHIMRVSTARSVELLREAKARELPISASVPWHHLIFDTQDLEHYDPNLRHEPPLGTPADREALIAGVSDGVIEAIAIDHSPYTYEENTVDFASAPPGAIGLELALPILWQTLVAGSPQWKPEQLWQALSYGPCQCLGLTPNTLQIGAAAELTLFDPRVGWQASAKTLKSRSHNTAWAEQAIKGKVIATWTA
ncbi:MAG: dihydroorotase [Phormidesmis sp.]